MEEYGEHGSELMHYDYFCCDYLIIVVPIFKIQVVSGIKYYLTVELGKTVCKKSSGPLPFSGIQKCELLPQDQQEQVTCYFQVWSRPWLKEIYLLNTNCY
uniref:Cystatin domain-containing protein n=1 Tax=Naja naja TaxID=35670 RepID=A0A8C6YLG6_NAJNA